MKKKKKFTVKVLFLQEGDYWVTQGLEYDVAAQGKTIAEAKKSFENTFLGQIVLDIKENRKPLEGISKAPEEFWNKFKEAKHLKDAKPFCVPDWVLPEFIIDTKVEDQRIYA